MAKTPVATNPKLKETKPTITVELTPDASLPTVGARVECTVAGKVISVSDRIDPWDNPKVRRVRVEIEYDRKAVSVAATTASAIAEMSDEAKRRLKKERPEEWREYLGGER